MISTPFAHSRYFLTGFLFVLTLAGCSTPQPQPKSASQDYAFVTYWPAKEGSKELRLAVKDMIDMKDTITTGGSQYLLKTGQPARKDAKCLAIARSRKVQIVGKTNVGELGMMVSGMNTYFGTPRNRMGGRSLRLIPGGSSSGSAVAVANDWADVAFGTDTAGSVRIPAACCGVYGLKTTYGLVSLDGVFPLSPKYLDTVGPMAKDIPRLAQGMDLLQNGFMAKYRHEAAVHPNGDSITVGRLYLDGTDPSIDRAIDAALIARGFKVVVLPVSFKESWERAIEHGGVIAKADIWTNHKQFIGQPGVSGTAQTIIAFGKLGFNEKYSAAILYKPRWQRELREVFKQVDFIALPTLKKAPPMVPLFGDVLFENRVFEIQSTIAVNFAENPAIAIPIPIKGKVPVTSLQLVGPPNSEAALVNAGRIFESKSEAAVEVAAR